MKSDNLRMIRVYTFPKKKKSLNDSREKSLAGAFAQSLCCFQLFIQRKLTEMAMNEDSAIDLMTWFLWASQGGAITI